MPRENGLENIVEIGQRIYEKLEQSGILHRHNGKTIWIHTDTETYVIGEGINGMTKLLNKVKVQPRYQGQSDNDITSRFYSRGIGRLGRIARRA